MATDNYQSSGFTASASGILHKKYTHKSSNKTP